MSDIFTVSNLPASADAHKIPTMATTTKTKPKASGKSGSTKSAKGPKTVKTAKPAAKSTAKPAKVGGSTGSLVRRLGIVENQVVVLIDAPSNLPPKIEEGLPDGVELRHSAMRGAGFDLAILFVPNFNTLNRRFSQLAKLMRPNGAVWVGWPSKTSGFHCDITLENARTVALKDGLTDAGLTDFDEIWTGARFIAKPAVIAEVK